MLNNHNKINDTLYVHMAIPSSKVVNQVLATEDSQATSRSSRNNEVIKIEET